MRFDDRLLTLMRYPTPDVGAKAAVWTQIVDVMAQDRNSLSPELRATALSKLDELRGDVPDRRRLACAVSIAGRALAVDLVALFAADIPAVAAPILTRAQLSDAQWADLLPTLPMPSRALLRERRDLSPFADRALASFGSSDFALPQAEPQQPAGLTDVTTPIGELVKRIEAYRSRDAQAVRSTVREIPQMRSFAFETDSAGIMAWIEGAPRGPLIGIALGEMAEPAGYGVDGQASGAFRKRAPIRDARLTVPGVGSAAGEWLITAQPFFDRASGRFEGYRGVARRTVPATASAGDALWTGMRPDSARQLVHELRTPLNAIRGFAEMIEGQYLGATEPAYRQKASSIIVDSGRLLRLFEDLDMSARLAGDEEIASAAGQSDLTRIMRSVATHHAGLIAGRAIKMQIILPDLPSVSSTDEATTVRLIDRLIFCVLCAAEDSETLRFSVSQSEGGIRIEAARPKLLIGLSTEALLDPTLEARNSLSTEEMPLGLAFVLRLLKQMARRSAGRFELAAESFVLILPSRADTAEETKESV